MHILLQNSGHLWDGSRQILLHFKNTQWFKITKKSLIFKNSAVCLHLLFNSQLIVYIIFFWLKNLKWDFFGDFKTLWRRRSRFKMWRKHFFQTLSLEEQLDQLKRETQDLRSHVLAKDRLIAKQTAEVIDLHFRFCWLPKYILVVF